MHTDKTQYEEELPKFCSCCGRPMVYTKPRPALSSFDSQTGEPDGSMHYTGSCVRLRGLWSKLGLRGMHSEYSVYENSNDPIVGGPHRSVLTMIR